MDYYSTLGLKRGASADEIKKAYRSMAMKHHPDRGGDEKRFKEIEEAYRTLSDPQKKQMFDSGIDPNRQSGFNQGPFEFHFGTENLNDLFGNFGFGFNQRQPRKNRSININVEISLEDVLLGKDLSAEINIPNSGSKMININIPPGMQTGQQIRYEGMGDNSIQGLRPGDLIVNVVVRPHHKFQRDGNSLIYVHTISVWDAMLGSKISIETLDKKTLDITIPAGTQPETVLSCRGEGLPDMRSRQKGNLLIKIKVDIPKNLSTDQINLIKQIKN